MDIVTLKILRKLPHKSFSASFIQDLPEDWLLPAKCPFFSGNNSVHLLLQSNDNHKHCTKIKNLEVTVTYASFCSLRHS